MNEKNKDLATWCKLLEEKTHLPPEVVPPDFYCTRDLSKKTGVSLTHTRVKLAEFVRLGKAEKKKFRVLQNGKDARTVWHYRLL